MIADLAELKPKTTSVSNETGPRRFRQLVVGHLLVASLPLLTPLVSLQLAWLPVIFFSLTIPVLATLMLLSFWIGMGGGRLVTRVIGGVAGAIYIGLTTSLAVMLVDQSVRFTTLQIAQTLSSAVLLNVIVVVLFGMAFLAYRRRVSLRRIDVGQDPGLGEWPRYSLLDLFAVMTLTAVCLALIQLGRASTPLSMTTWTNPFVVVMGYLLFFANTFYAAHAALGSRPLPRVLLVLVFAGLLGLVFGAAGRDDELAWWMVPVMGAIWVVGTLVVVFTLLVVRSAGYRLVPKSESGTELSN